MRLEVDRKGRVTDPELHDGLLVGIIMQPDQDELTLLCRQVDGREIRITIPEIVRLRVDNFLQGNIIFSLLIHEGDACPTPSVRRVYSYDDDDEARRYLSSRIKEIKDGCWTLVEVNTSYGCELLALSRARADRIAVA
jgi:hypothetical protein